MKLNIPLRELREKLNKDFKDKYPYLSTGQKLYGIMNHNPNGFKSYLSKRNLKKNLIYCEVCKNKNILVKIKNIKKRVTNKNRKTTTYDYRTIIRGYIGKYVCYDCLMNLKRGIEIYK